MNEFDECVDRARGGLFDYATGGNDRFEGKVNQFNTSRGKSTVNQKENLASDMESMRREDKGWG